MVAHRIRYLVIHLATILTLSNTIALPISLSIPNELHLSTTMSTLDDVINLLKESEGKRSQERAKDKEDLAIERAKDKTERAEELTKLTESITGLIKAGVKDEVETAIKPLKEAQDILHEEHSKLLGIVARLQERFTSFEAASHHEPMLTDTLDTLEQEPAASVSNDEPEQNKIKNIVHTTRTCTFIT